MIKVLYFTHANFLLRKGHVRNIARTVEALNQRNTAAVKIASTLWSCVEERRSFDILYFRDPKLFLQVFFIKYLLSKKVVFEIHGSEEWRGLSWLWRLSFRMSDGIIFITEGLKEWYGKTDKPSAVAFVNAPDLWRFTGDEQKINDWKKRHSIPQGKTTLLYAGSALWYNLVALIDMISRLPESCILVIAGLKGSEQEQLEKEAKLKSVRGRVILSSRYSDVEGPLWLSSGDILLNPLKVGYPGSISSKIYEYLAAGRPIISTKNRAIEEVLRDGENAVLVDEATGEKFAKAAENILSDAKLRERVSRQAREEAKNYTWEKRAAIIEDVLEKVNESH